MSLFVLVALLCTDSGSCEHYALDSNLSDNDCSYYFTDSGVDVVDGLIIDLVTYEVKEPLTLETLECIQEETK